MKLKKVIKPEVISISIELLCNLTFCDLEGEEYKVARQGFQHKVLNAASNEDIVLFNIGLKNLMNLPTIEHITDYYVNHSDANYIIAICGMDVQKAIKILPDIFINGS